MPPALHRRYEAKRPKDVPRRPPGRLIVPSDLSKTLLIIPCSGAKREYAEDEQASPPVTEYLPAELASELLEARRRLRQGVSFDDTTLAPAWQRYDGALYQAGRQAIGDLMEAGTHIVILSGGYGVVLAREPIGMYQAKLTASSWPAAIIERVLVAYANVRGLSSVRALVSATGPYIEVLQRVRWREAGVEDALLVTPQPEPGGMRRSPATQGEAIVALCGGTLTRDWQSSYGLGVHVQSM
jgi:hypothetical protein